MNLRQSLLVKGMRILDNRFQTNGGVIGSLASGRAGQRAGVAMDHFTWKKVLNFLRIELQLKSGRTQVKGYPYEWEIDTTNICHS